MDLLKEMTVWQAILSIIALLLCLYAMRIILNVYQELKKQKEISEDMTLSLNKMRKMLKAAQDLEKLKDMKGEDLWEGLNKLTKRERHNIVELIQERNKERSKLKW